MKYIFFILLLMILANCQTLRMPVVSPEPFSDKAFTGLIRGVCNGKPFLEKGVFACEEKAPGTIALDLKALPIQGRVVHANGETKKIEDFNWKGESGFWFWRKKRLDETWLSLTLGDLTDVYHDHPISFDVIGYSESGIINVSSLVYYRLCDDQNPCTTLEYSIQCGGVKKNIGSGEIGYCQRMSGTTQEIEVKVKALGKLQVYSPRTNFRLTLDITKDDVANGFVTFTYPKIENGPDLIGIKTDASSGRLLMVGFGPAWTGIDKPHYLANGDGVEWTKPVGADLLEVVTDGLIQTTTGSLKVSPKQKTCAYAYQRQSGDVQYLCLDAKLNEVAL